MRYLEALLKSRGRDLPAPVDRPMKSLAQEVADQEERIAQDTYRQHLRVDDEHQRLLQQLVGERDVEGVALEDIVYYTGLGVLVENNVRGLIREWQKAG